jgi:hypothetical protein
VPASKPKHKHRVVLPITCSIAQKKAIDKALSHIPPRQKSKYILELIRQAIALKYTTIADDESYTHGTNTEFQISCSPDERQIIYNYCDHYLPSGKRSRWIVSLTLNLDK